MLWDLVVRHKKRAQLLHAYELDHQDGGSRSKDLLWSLVDIHVEQLRTNTS